MNTLFQIKEKIKKINLFLEAIENEEISNIEKDIILEKIRNLYEFIIQNSNTQHITQNDENLIKEINKLTEKSDKETLSEKNLTEIEFVEDNNPVSTEKDSETKHFQTEKQNTQDRIESKKTQEKQETNQTKLNTNNENQVKTIGESLGKDKTSLNEIIGQNKQQNDMFSKLSSKPIQDIKSAIGIGDRFLYIRELFNANNELFDITITKLNQLSNYEEALEYLKNNFNWDFNDEIVLSFLAIVRRRYL